MNKLNTRIKTYSNMSTQLSLLSDRQLAERLEDAEHVYSGIGGKAAVLTIDNTKIFVKKIPLTDLERRPENMMSTANIFELPFSSHIGVGSAGFSSWRELFLHTMTTNWVINRECQNFPILYHWRVLPADKPNPMTSDELEKLEKDVKYWDNSSAVRDRLEAIHNASAHVFLFLEYVPQTLDKWLAAKLTVGGEVAATALDFLENKLKETNEFMNSHGLIHFDAHFDNILADDNTIYVSDFGLALCSLFEISKEEADLFDNYLTYDRCSSATNFLHCIIASLLGKDRWSVTLKNIANDELREVEPSVAIIIKRYAAIAEVMADYYQNMQKVSKSTPYPAEKLKKLLDQIGNVKQGKVLEICPATEMEAEYIHCKITEYVNNQVPFTQSPEMIYKNYVIKDNGKIVAGINADIYYWRILFIDVLYVDEAYRNRNIGSELIKRVESEAKAMGATIAHLENLDARANDFYLKSGYEIFGELENCPQGHKRYYLFKSLQK
jgi:N-acetylglutamate synthase-like GNAT family acetyltransferase